MATFSRDTLLKVVPHIQGAEADEPFDPNTGRPSAVETKSVEVYVTLGELIDYITSEIQA